MSVMLCNGKLTAHALLYVTLGRTKHTERQTKLKVPTVPQLEEHTCRALASHSMLSLQEHNYHIKDYTIVTEIKSIACSLNIPVVDLNKICQKMFSHKK